MNEQLTRSQTHPAPWGLVGSGRLPARLRHRRALLVPPVPSLAAPPLRGAA